jgi:hypothetical protein
MDGRASVDVARVDLCLLVYISLGVLSRRLTASMALPWEIA